MLVYLPPLAGMSLTSSWLQPRWGWGWGEVEAVFSPILP